MNGRFLSSLFTLVQELAQRIEKVLEGHRYGFFPISVVLGTKYGLLDRTPAEIFELRFGTEVGEEVELPSPTTAVAAAAVVVAEPMVPPVPMPGTPLAAAPAVVGSPAPGLPGIVVVAGVVHPAADVAGLVAAPLAAPHHVFATGDPAPATPLAGHAAAATSKRRATLQQLAGYLEKKVDKNSQATHERNMRVMMIFDQ